MSLHADALSVLDGWRAPGPEQEALRERYVAHLRARPDAMRREGRPDHLTASTLVLSDDGEQVLLTLHAKARRWFQLGGHCEDDDPTLAAAARREAAEESGLDDLRLDPRPVQLSAHPVPFCGGPPHRPVHHLDVRFLALAAPGARPRTSAESIDLRWWPADDLPEPEPDLVELVALSRARLAQSASASSPASPSAADQPIR